MNSLHLLFQSDDSLADAIEELDMQELDHEIFQTQTSLASLFENQKSSTNESSNDYNNCNNNKNSKSRRNEQKACKLVTPNKSMKCQDSDELKHCKTETVATVLHKEHDSLEIEFYDISESESCFSSTASITNSLIEAYNDTDYVTNGALSGQSVESATITHLNTPKSLNSISPNSNDPKANNINARATTSNASKTNNKPVKSCNNDKFKFNCSDANIASMYEIVSKFDGDFPFCQLNPCDVTYLYNIVKNNFDNIKCIRSCILCDFGSFRTRKNEQSLHGNELETKTLKVKLYFYNSQLPDVVFFKFRNDSSISIPYNMDDIIRQYNMCLIQSGHKGNVTNVFVTRGIKLF